MKTYVVSVMLNGSSTFWLRITATSPEEAVEKYINSPIEASSGARHVQRHGGLIVVGVVLVPSLPGTSLIAGHGIQLFRVAPGPKPQPRPAERAHIVEQVTA